MLDLSVSYLHFFFIHLIFQIFYCKMLLLTLIIFIVSFVQINLVCLLYLSYIWNIHEEWSPFINFAQIKKYLPCNIVCFLYATNTEFVADVFVHTVIFAKKIHTVTSNNLDFYYTFDYIYIYMYTCNYM